MPEPKTCLGSISSPFSRAEEEEDEDAAEKEDALSRSGHEEEREGEGRPETAGEEEQGKEVEAGVGFFVFILLSFSRPSCTTVSPPPRIATTEEVRRTSERKKNAEERTEREGLTRARGADTYFEGGPRKREEKTKRKANAKQRDGGCSSECKEVESERERVEVANGEETGSRLGSSEEEKRRREEDRRG